MVNTNCRRRAAKGNMAMCRKIKKSGHIHENEAVRKYPDSYIIMRMSGIDSQSGEVLYVGDDEDELLSVLDSLDNQMYCGILEGQNIRRVLGGVMVG